MIKAFKAYDIRGVWEKDLDVHMIYRIGYFLPQVLNSTHILVGRDARNSSPVLFDALCRGINDAGADVSNAGITTTPMIYWGTGKYHFTGSVMITASHNPPHYNGLKVSAADVVPVGYETGLKWLEELVESGLITPKARRGEVKDFDFKDDYLAFLQQYSGNFSNLRIGVDCSNGMAALLIKTLLGKEAFYINDHIDGNFPGHEPNPLEPENQEQIKQLVINRQCDIGLIFDGDADRVMFIDENGRFVSPDLIIALLGHYFFEQKGGKGLVLQDIRSSRAIAEYLSQFGAEVKTWRVGRAYGAGKLREIDGIYGGELAGHYYFRDFYYSDSAMVAALIVLQLISQFKASGFSFSQLIKHISGYYNTGEINFRISQKQQAMDAVIQHFIAEKEPLQMMDFDGYRLDYPDFWLNIRPSNTEPYLRFLAEARTAEKLAYVENTVREIVSRFE
ncbi:MAG TPA: phosphomannomutase/phosphoglucomutase [Bacteroidales bacterium]|nr:phosphomannomutase/phosphoglucomutase [Bacteroidales bacterium]